MLSTGKVHRYNYTHTGWREIGDKWVYLHADGAIGAGQSDDVDVSLPNALAPFRLPPLSDEKTTRQAINATMGLIMLAPDHIIIPLMAAVMRSVLGPSDFSLNLVGSSNAFKSELAALAMQHFGAGFTSRNLPASWTSTENALEGLAFQTKDTLLVIDDFAPRGSNSDVQRFHSKADRVLRAQGSNAGRGRMNADSTLRVTKAPRGMILSTGEDAPQGHSLRSRQLLLEVAPGDVDAEILTRCQQDARAGLYAKTMSAFLCDLAPNYGRLRESLHSQVEELRQEAHGTMRRTSEIVANLFIGWRTFLDFALRTGAITPDEKEHHEHTGLKALQLAASQQGAHQQSNEPAERFLELISQCLSSGRAHLASAAGLEPRMADAWGWRIVTIGTGENMRDEWREQGTRIGFVDEDDVYLVPDAAYEVAKRLSGQSGDGLSIAPKTLSKRLHERGLLLTTDETRQTLSIRPLS